MKTLTLRFFDTRSPARPNPILASAVELVRREKNKLIVKGFEAVDQSPVIDIKPYNVNYLKKPSIPGMDAKNGLFQKSICQGNTFS